MNKLVRKVISVAIALLAIAVCFQIISVNKNRLFPSNDQDVAQYRDQIMTALDVKNEVKMVANDTQPTNE
ncbi:MAG: hypothetical protein KJ737_27200 [Proteobacteria bacterium]|nr:hypothetical protein [Pseudomonadota bacterium]